jgi:FAD/FMN-containing dehydrogenase
MTDRSRLDGHTQELAEIQRIVGEKGWSTDPGVLSAYTVDETKSYRGRSCLLVMPKTAEEVSAIVAVCARAGVPIVPQGGNTGLVGGGTPDGTGAAIVLGLSRMNAIRAVSAQGNTITVEAGCTLLEIQKAAEEADRYFPLSIGSEGTAQIGGALSTNAGGVQVLRYGNARDLMLGLEVVLPNGEILSTLKGLRKDNTGYDLKQIFVGAEGTLGIITGAVLKLFPQPRGFQTALVGLSNVGEAMELLSRLRTATGDAVSACELMSRTTLQLVLRNVPGFSDPMEDVHEWYLLVECSAGDNQDILREILETELAEALERGAILDAVLAENEVQRATLWRMRHTIGESRKPEGVCLDHDIAVSPADVPDFIARASREVHAIAPEGRLCIYGHIGDGNIHFRVLQPDPREGSAHAWDDPDYTARISAAVYDTTLSMDGSISAEHGIGQAKVEKLEKVKSSVELALMRKIKNTLDPQGIMNPGKVLVPCPSERPSD